jgi:hypothetical protein
MRPEKFCLRQFGALVAAPSDARHENRSPRS